MGEYVWTKIWLGGKVKRSDLPKVAEIIRDHLCPVEEATGIDDNNMPFGGEPIYLAGLFNYGSMGDYAKETLFKLGLGWREHYEACGGNWSAGINQVEPGSEWSGALHEEPSCLADEDGPAISLGSLQDRALSGHTLDKVIADLKRFDTDFPPIEIVEG